MEADAGASTLGRRAGAALLKRAGLRASACAGKGSGTEVTNTFAAARWGNRFSGEARRPSQKTQKKRLLSPRLARQFHGLTSWEAIKPIRQRFEDKAWEKSHLNWMSYIDLNLRLPELLLMRVDKMSMGVSLEGRVPFLDHKFVELAMSIPEKVKTKNGTLKYILKKSVRGVIPDELIDRPKQGFGVPVYEWFFDRLGEICKIRAGNILQKDRFLEPMKCLVWWRKDGGRKCGIC